MDSNFTKLTVLDKSHKLVLLVYRLTATFPNNEIYGLVSQIRRAAVSISSNIVEGKSRETSNEFRRFLIIARGSLEELKYQMYLSKDLSYIIDKDYEEFSKEADVVGRLLNGLMKSLN